MNYNIYRLKLLEVVRYLAEYTALALFISYLFYDSLKMAVLLLPGLAFYIDGRRKDLLLTRKKELAKQFKDMIQAVATGMNAGYSVENSFREAYGDMVKLNGEDSLICREMKGFLREMEAGLSIEKVLLDFSLRSGVEEVKDFAEIFAIAKRSGGNFSEMIGRTVGIMQEKDETEREIEVMLSGKRYEQKIMGVIPLFIILYLKLGSGGFIYALYHNPAGTGVMSACLLVYFVSWLLARKIAFIEV
ncbi:MAG: type II secretion system F family protein [Lachnospiraceae bacterium]|nr:type II secretion system F family protein [Lachnospiraceae bacterium]